MRRILITGGAGFIGSHAVRHFVNHYKDDHIYNVDALTYAGNLENLLDIKDAANYTFIKANIADEKEISGLFKKYEFTHIIHFAAESHVDRSIEDPFSFIKTNILGTVNLLHQAKTYWSPDRDHCFYHISTDEVYGSLGPTGLFTESTAYDPKSPYSASKASSDHFVRAFSNTYNLPIKISNCSNNYGPYQFPEKLIPLIINNIVNGKSLPVYGDGSNIRDWLFVQDHVEAIDCILTNGELGSTYNIGGLNEVKNLSLVKMLCDISDEYLGNVPGTSQKLITFVKDRPGHDHRYAIDASRIENELGWKPKISLKEGLHETIKWYLNNKDWLSNVASNEYQKFYARHYGE